MHTDTADQFESQVINHLRLLRGEVVILDSDLAWFLGLAPADVLAAPGQRPELFPSDFVFRLSETELRALTQDSPCLTAHGISGRKRLAFTTHGAGMLLTAFPDEKFSLAAIPVLRAFANYWKAKEAATTGQRPVNRNS